MDTLSVSITTVVAIAGVAIAYTGYIKNKAKASHYFLEPRRDTAR